MINMAVVSLKDIIKYLFKLTILIVIIIFLTKLFAKKEDGIKQQIEAIDNSYILTTCFKCTLPETTLLNQKDENVSIIASTEPLKLALGMELEMLSTLEKNENNESVNEQSESNENQTENIKEENNVEIEKAKTGMKTEVQSSNVPEKYTTQYNGVKIKNEAKYKLTKEILKPNITLKKENILIFHTHSCESYTASEKYKYTQTGNFRTTDKNYSVIRVGNELETQLLSYGYNVIHDEEYHDYPSYSGSYSSSLKTVTKLLEKNPNTDVVIDLHRDAIADSKYAPTVKIGDEYAAQLMFVIGGNGSSIKHENWQQNLKFAIKVQEKANELYPGLFKPIILRKCGYNQHVSKAATILEVGATGNTLDQTLISMKYLAKVLSEVVK